MAALNEGLPPRICLSNKEGLKRVEAFIRGTWNLIIFCKIWCEKELIWVVPMRSKIFRKKGKKSPTLMDFQRSLTLAEFSAKWSLQIGQGCHIFFAL